MSELTAEQELLRLMHSATAVRIQRDGEVILSVTVETASQQTFEISPEHSINGDYLHISVHTYTARVL